MAEAKKCDRCGQCFDPLGVGEALFCRFRNPALQNSIDYKDCKRTSMLNPDMSPDYIMDLCPCCTTEFVMFMNGWDFNRVENTQVNG